MNDDLYDRILGFIALAGKYRKDILDREEQIKVLQDEIKVIQNELNLSFDEWNNCTDPKQKDKLEWKRNKVAAPINPKVYCIQGLKKEIKDIESQILVTIKNGYEHSDNGI